MGPRPFTNNLDVGQGRDRADQCAEANVGRAGPDPTVRPPPPSLRSLQLSEVQRAYRLVKETPLSRDSVPLVRSFIAAPRVEAACARSHFAQEKLHCPEGPPLCMTIKRRCFARPRLGIKVIVD